MNARVALPMVFALILSGCGSSGPAREDIYYRLDLQTQPPSVGQTWPGTLLVAKLDGRGFAGDRAIVFRDETKQDQVQRYTYHLWAEAPPLTIQDLLAAWLRGAKTSKFVVTPSQRVSADLVVSGTLFRFEHRPFTEPPSVRIELELAAVRSDRRELLFLKRYETSITAVDERIVSAVPAFNRGLEQIFGAFLSDLEGQLEELETPRRSGSPARSRERR